MDRFKVLLREAVSKQCAEISLHEGDFAIMTLPEGKVQSESHGLVDRNWLDVVYKAIFPSSRDQLAKGDPCVGGFNLQGKGKVFAVAQIQDLAALWLFMPPDGEAKCRAFWEEFNRAREESLQAEQTTTPEPSSEQEDRLAPTEPLPEMIASKSDLDQDEDSQDGNVPNPEDQLFSLDQAPDSSRYSSLKPDQAPDEDPSAISPEEQLLMSPPNLDSETDDEIDDDLDQDRKTNDELSLDGGSDYQPGYVRQREQILDEENDGPDLQDLHEHADPILHKLDEEGKPESDLASVEDLRDDQNHDLKPSQPPVDKRAQARNDGRSEDILSEPNDSIPSETPNELESQAIKLSGDGYRSEEPNYDFDHHAEESKEDLAMEVDFSNEIQGSVSIGDGSNPIDQVLKAMIKHRASDLHLTIGQPLIFRVDGDICRTNGPKLNSDVMRSYILPMMPLMKQKDFMDSWDTDFAYEVIGLGRFRVNVYRDHNGVASVLRHIPDKVLSVEELGLPDSITKLCHLSKGLVLVTGPTGSGKSTTLAAMIDLINRTRPEHILTIEDPIEFVHQQKRCLVNQREVKKHTGSFSTALKAALREDPDIVLVGELRDLETTAIAIETAETGHLVFATLHTNTAVSTVDRVVDQFPADKQRIIRNMFASSIKGVVAQSLCKRQGGGRCAAYEILIPNDAVGAMIRESKNHMIANHMQTQQADGNCLMSESLAKLVASGTIGYWEGWKKSIDKKEYEEITRRKKITVPKKDN